eukprot:scaffold1954_cov268-Pinguiococcus_pyrenoidosus.AAC.119
MQTAPAAASFRFAMAHSTVLASPSVKNSWSTPHRWSATQHHMTKGFSRYLHCVAFGHFCFRHSYRGREDRLRSPILQPRSGEALVAGADSRPESRTTL